MDNPIVWLIFAGFLLALAVFLLIGLWRQKIIDDRVPEKPDWPIQNKERSALEIAVTIRDEELKRLKEFMSLEAELLASDTHQYPPEFEERQKAARHSWWSRELNRISDEYSARVQKALTCKSDTPLIYTRDERR